jgi:hypothetical protein
MAMMIGKTARLSIVMSIGLALAVGLTGQALVASGRLDLGNEAHPPRQVETREPSGLVPPSPLV